MTSFMIDLDEPALTGRTDTYPQTGANQHYATVPYPVKQVNLVQSRDDKQSISYQTSDEDSSL